MNWFFSETIGKYVCLQPVRVSSKVFSAAQNAGIALDWDDCGNIINLSFEEARKLAGCLKGQIMTPSEYWKVFKEAKALGREDVISSLTARDYAEFLNRVYVGDGEYIDDPFVMDNYEYVGNIVRESIITGRPGWILPEDIDEATGHPFRVREKTKTDGLMKYWSPDLSVTKIGKCFAIRGYVTSVASMSLDLGIPVDSRQPKQMLRICMKERPDDYIESEAAEDFDALLAEKDFDRLEAFKKSDAFKQMMRASDSAICKDAELLYFTLGKIRLEKNIPGSRTLSFEDISDYIFTCRAMLDEAIQEKKQLIFVVGHRNPDTDTVISSLFEACRLSMTNCDEDTVFLPLVQSDIMPAEIARLLGEDFYPELIYENDLDMDALAKTGRVRFVYTDQNYQRDIQKYVLGITDHHSLNAEYEQREGVPCIVEKVGSCTALIALKYMGMGYGFDSAVARILYGAMLMDTENRVSHKMTAFDRSIMDLMKQSSGVSKDEEFYSELMSELISETDIGTLYYRDYKTFRGFGFSVIKVYDFIDKECFPRKIKKFKDIAHENNRKSDLYLTLIKLVEYEKGGLKVSRERLYYVFNDTADNEMRAQVLELLEDIPRHFLAEATVTGQDGYIEISNTGRQLSRKKIAPAIESLLGALTHYVYVSAIDKYVARDFLHKNSALEKLDIPVNYDDKGRVCNITYDEAKKIAEGLGMGMLDLREFWLTYDEAVNTGNLTLIASMSSGDFIEYLDTVAVDGKLIYKPNMNSGYPEGEPVTVEILPAVPGLISPRDIDKESGLPTVVHSPAEYGDKTLWRYWSPADKGIFIFSRSHIFLIGQACLDAKMLPGENFANLGMRPASERKPADQSWTEISENCLRIWYKSAFEEKPVIVYEAQDFCES